MFDTLKKLKYGARVFLAKGGGQPETVEVAGRSTTLLSGGDGPPFVYLHSTLSESSLWLPFHQTWAKQFKVIAPTHPGFPRSDGQEPSLEGIDTIEDMAFHYLELFDALGLEEVNLGGVSLGGWIAAEFALRWPERVRRLWISGAPGFWIDDQPLPDLFRVMTHPGQLRKLLFADPESYIARMLIQDQADDERRIQGYQAMTVLARLVWERPYDPKLAARLHRIRCPVLLLWGEQDALVPPSYGREYQKHIPQAEFQTIPNCGHLGMFEAEADFVARVAKFCG